MCRIRDKRLRWTSRPCASAPARASGRFRLHPAFLLLLLALPILALPIPAQSSSSIRSDGLLEVDGEPFFPVGLVELGPTRYEDWNDPSWRVYVRLRHWEMANYVRRLHAFNRAELLRHILRLHDERRA